jgi:hypothetical protein
MADGAMADVARPGQRPKEFVCGKRAITLAGTSFHALHAPTGEQQSRSGFVVERRIAAGEIVTVAEVRFRTRASGPLSTQRGRETRQADRADHQNPELLRGDDHDRQR